MVGAVVEFLRRAAGSPFSIEYQLMVALGAGLALGLLVAGGGTQP
jgi:hypothetical protein